MPKEQKSYLVYIYIINKISVKYLIENILNVTRLTIYFERISFLMVQVKQKSKLLAENAAERQKLFVQAFCAEDGTSPLALISQAKSCGTGTKFFQSIKTHQVSNFETSLLLFIYYYYTCTTEGFG